nr:rep protein [Cressdnaviricota sp.]
MGDRSTCWSLTINNPTEDDMNAIRECPVPGWKIQGQMEKGENGTEHYQGMLRTPQVRFSAVKKVYPRAHIEIARNAKALEKYVTKEDTRIAVVESEHIPSIFEYQSIIAEKWVDDEYETMVVAFPRKDRDDIAMLYLDTLVSRDIVSGRRGAEWIATNPMWRNAWKKFWRSIITRHANSSSLPHPTQGEETGNGPSPSNDIQQFADFHGDSGNGPLR